MILQHFKPSFPLQKFIDYCWIAESPFSMDIPVHHIPLPKGNPLLFFNYSREMSFRSHIQDGERKAEEVPPSFVLGVLTSKHKNEIKGKVGVLGIFFKPTGFFQLFGCPMSAFTDQHIDLVDVLGQEINFLSEQLGEAADNFQRIELVEAFLLARLKSRTYKAGQATYAAEKIRQHKGAISLSKLAADLKMSERHLRRTFTEQIGVSPKYFARIERFNYSISLGKTALNWFDIVETCGYYDQAHFIKEINHFCGQSPSIYFPNISQIDAFFHG